MIKDMLPMPLVMVHDVIVVVLVDGSSHKTLKDHCILSSGSTHFFFSTCHFLGMLPLEFQNCI
jgi:hypothetical protein